MPDGEDTAVDPMQAAGGDPPCDGPFAQPAMQQLGERDHAMLLRSNLGDQRVRFPSVCGGDRTHRRNLSARTSHGTTQM
jgi:hypothetical protein